MSTNMAEKLKRRISAKSITAMILFGAICLVFVFFGLPGRLGAGVGSVARVNNTLISIADFQQEEQRVQQYYASLFGGGMDLSSQRQLLRQQALENLVRTELGSQAARADGIHATDGEVRDFIVNQIPFFQEEGRFRRDRYDQYLAQTRSSAGEFENKVRKDIENQRSQHLFEIVGRPNAVENAKLKALKETKLNVGFVRLEQDQLLKNFNISEAEAQKALSDPEFAKKAQENFEANKGTYEQKEEVHAQHILIAAKEGDAAAGEAALKKATEIRKSADKEDFGKLAAKFSDDPGSKSKNGDLGFFGRGAMVPEFEKAAFEMKAGEISAPIKSPFGYHLIKVLAKHEAKAANFDALKIKVAQNLLAREKVDGLLRSLDESLIKNDEAKVTADLKALGANWDETGFFEMGAEALPKIQSPVVRDSVYEMTSAQPLLKRLVRDGNFKYVLKLKGSKTESVSSATAAEDEAIQRRRGQGLREAWIGQFRKSSRVEMNAQALQTN